MVDDGETSVASASMDWSITHLGGALRVRVGAGPEGRDLVPTLAEENARLRAENERLRRG